MAPRASRPLVRASTLAVGVAITLAAGVAFGAIDQALDPDVQPRQLYSIAADGTDLQRLTTDDRHDYWGPAWSPDGPWLAYTVVVPDAAGQLYVSNAGGTCGTDTRQITHDAFGG
jgi:hypothetical protein